MIRPLLVALTGLLLANQAPAAEVQVAVAANFAAPMQRLAALFERESGHRVVASPGSTGKLAAQIRNGAPFEVFLAADDETPQALEQSAHAVAGSRFTYALGRLVLWSRDPARVDANGAVLREGSFARLAVADPRLAPYGVAALQTLRGLGLLERLQPRLVTGESVSQAYQFAATGNAELGFVALSQVWSGGRIAEGSAWIVPERLHQPIRQQAALLVRGRDNPAAAAWLAFLRSEAARTVIRDAGYGLE